MFTNISKLFIGITLLLFTTYLNADVNFNYVNPYAFSIDTPTAGANFNVTIQQNGDKSVNMIFQNNSNVTSLDYISFSMLFNIDPAILNNISFFNVPSSLGPSVAPFGFTTAAFKDAFNMKVGFTDSVLVDPGLQITLTVTDLLDPIGTLTPSSFLFLSFPFNGNPGPGVYSVADFNRDNRSWTLQGDPVTVGAPEPATYLLLGTFLGVIALLRRFSKKRVESPLTFH